MVNPISWPSAASFVGQVSPTMDFSELGKLGEMIQQKQQEAEAARLIGQIYGQGQPGQQPPVPQYGAAAPRVMASDQASNKTYGPNEPSPFDTMQYGPGRYGPIPLDNARPPVMAQGEGLDRALGVIRQKESGGNYGNVTTTRNSRGQPQSAIGAYGVMDFNVGPWTKEVFGREMTPDEFRNNPEAQDAVARAKLGQYAQKYGLTGAAKAWFAGEGGMNNPAAQDPLGTSVAGYAADFERKMGGVPQRAISSLTSGQPAGIGREQIQALAANPLTRPLAVSLLQSQLAPGKYSFQQIGDTLVRTNDRTGQTEVVMRDTKPFTVGDSLVARDAAGNFVDITPASARKPITIGEGQTGYIRNADGSFTQIGGSEDSKLQREIKQRTAAALSAGYPQETANYYGLNGKLPKEDLSATEMKIISDNQKQVTSANDVLDNLDRLKELSPTAWSGWGATKRASVVNALLPNEFIPKGAVDAKELSNIALQNVAGQAKAMFGARLAVAEVKLLNEIESTPEMSDAERQRIYTRIERMIKRHRDDAQGEIEGIRNKTFFKPGGGGTAIKAEEEPPKPSTGPGMQEFVLKARAANPGVSDADLVKYWKQKYGNK